MAVKFVKARSYSFGGTRSLSSVKYIVIHYTGNKGDTAIANANYFKNSNTRSAGAHFFVDRKGTIVQSVPLNRVAWSVGGFFTQSGGAGSYYKKCTNFNSVSIELCDVADKDPSAAQIKAVKSLVAQIRKKCPNARTIIRHWDVNGKECPARMAGKGNAKWPAFLAEISGGAVKTSSKAGSSKTAKVIAKSGLNMRQKARVTANVITAIPYGTKVTVKKTGATWAKISYAGKVGYVVKKYLK